MTLESTPRPLGEVPLGLLLAASLFFLPLGAWLVETQTIELTQCGFKRMFDLPCFSCGSTRATIHFLHGRVFTALAFQPLTLLIYVLLLVWGAFSGWALATRRSVRLRLGKREDIAVKLGLIALPLINWVYLWAAGI